MPRLRPVSTPLSRAYEIGTVLVAAALAATAMLPSTAADRPALLTIAGTLIAGGFVWFRVLPQSWFGSARPMIGASITQLTAAALLAMTGGAQSSGYFGLYSVPVLSTVFQLRPQRTLAVGALGMGFYWVVFLATRDPANPAVRDTAVLRSVAYAAVVTVAWLLTRALAHTRAELVTERSRLRAIINALEQPVLVTTAGAVESANTAALAFFGPSIIGRPFQQVMPNAGAGPSVIVDVTGRSQSVDLIASSLPGPADAQVWVAHDVSHYVEANRMREQLLYAVAHELRGPLSVLDTSLDVVASDLGSLTMAELTDLLSRARRSVTRMRSLMEDLLSAGNIQAGRFVVRPSQVELGPIVRESVDQVMAVAQGRAQKIVIDVSDSFEVRADPRYLRQVLHNLLSNASNYGGAGTEITVHARREPSIARVSVDDRGPGIASDQHAGLFDRFYRVRGTSDGGVGLGLAIAKGIIAAHGGSIGVDSDVGRGTSVWFTLPLAGGEQK